MGKHNCALQLYEPKFKIDDGFRLTREPTLDALESDIRKFHEFSLRSADVHLVSIFLCGVALLRARDLLPKARRGLSGDSQDGSGFIAWKQKHFPRHVDTLGRYMRFAENVFAESLNRHVPVLETGHSGFELTREGVPDLMRALGEAMDGKTMTAMYRSIKRLRGAQIGAGGQREGPRPKRTRDQIELDKLRDRAAADFPKLKKLLTEWLASKLYLYIADKQLIALKELLHDSKTAVTELAAQRKTGAR